MTTNHYDVLIIGAGISGLTTAHFLKKQNPELSVSILEASNRPGGAIQSMREDGFLAEWGAHGFLDNIEENGELLSDLKLGEEIQKAPLKQFVRYVCLNGKIIMVPQSPPAIIKSNLMSFPAKLRVLADLWKKPREEELSISQWTRYRFGRAMVKFADVAATGTYAGDIEKLSIDATYPGIRRLEKEYGSVFRGAVKSRKKKSGKGMPSMISFKNGMEYLPERLSANHLIHYNTRVESFRFDQDIWSIVAGKQQFSANHIVLALPVNAALTLLKTLETPPVNQVPEAIVTNVTLGFKEPANVPFGFGYLAPREEKRFALGTLFSTHMFPQRAPEGLCQIEILVGGLRNPEYCHLDDSELISRALKDVKQLINLPEKPVFSRVIRPKSGIPQLEMGHLRLVDYKDRLQQNMKGLHICGFGWEGIGINDMIKQAKQTAMAVQLGQSVSKEPARAKPIYL